MSTISPRTGGVGIRVMRLLDAWPENSLCLSHLQVKEPRQQDGKEDDNQDKGNEQAQQSIGLCCLSGRFFGMLITGKTAWKSRFHLFSGSGKYGSRSASAG